MDHVNKEELIIISYRSADIHLFFGLIINQADYCRGCVSVSRALVGEGCGRQWQRQRGSARRGREDGQAVAACCGERKMPDCMLFLCDDWRQALL